MHAQEEQVEKEIDDLVASKDALAAERYKAYEQLIASLRATRLGDPAESSAA